MDPRPRCAFCRGQGVHFPGCTAAGRDFAEQMDKVERIVKAPAPTFIPRYAKMYVVQDRGDGTVYLVTTSHLDAKREQRRHHRALLKELTGDSSQGWSEQ